MRRLNKIESVEIRQGVVFFNGESIHIGENMNSWLAQFNYADYSVDHTNAYFDLCTIRSLAGVNIYSKQGVIFQISFSLFPNSVRIAQKLVIDGREIHQPFYSSDVQSIFPGIKLQTLPSIYKEKFDPNWPNDYEYLDTIKFAIYVDRDIKYISLICLKSFFPESEPRSSVQTEEE